MATKSQIRRKELRKTLLDLAEKRIAADGLGNLRARELAKEAGCALGAIYNVFKDMNGLIMAVNGRTFLALGKTVGASVQDKSDLPAPQQLIVMSHAYLHFAAEHPNLWRALFDLQMSVDDKVPDWYLAELGRLFDFITKPLREIYPGMGDQELDLMTRALFSSVHGIVLLGLERRISGVPINQIEKMISLVLSQVAGSENN